MMKVPVTRFDNKFEKPKKKYLVDFFKIFFKIFKIVLGNFLGEGGNYDYFPLKFTSFQRQSFKDLN